MCTSITYIYKSNICVSEQLVQTKDFDAIYVGQSLPIYTSDERILNYENLF